MARAKTRRFLRRFLKQAYLQQVLGLPLLHSGFLGDNCSYNLRSELLNAARAIWLLAVLPREDEPRLAALRTRSGALPRSIASCSSSASRSPSPVVGTSRYERYQIDGKRHRDDMEGTYGDLS